MFDQLPKLEREHEVASAFSRYLTRSGHAVVWEHLKKDPPDFLFMVDGRKWGVEETIIPMPLVVAGRAVGRLTITQALERRLRQLCDDIIDELPRPSEQGYFIMP